jgi:hypothetical protein
MAKKARGGQTGKGGAPAHEAFPASRTRGRVPSTEERIELIRRLMATHSWSARARAALATQWGLSEKRVRDLATEASHSLRTHDPEKIEQLRAELAGTFSEIIRMAMTTPSRVTGLPDLRSAIDAATRFGEYSGVAPVAKSELKAELTGKDGGPIETRGGYDDILAKLSVLAGETAVVESAPDAPPADPGNDKPDDK